MEELKIADKGAQSTEGAPAKPAQDAPIRGAPIRGAPIRGAPIQGASAGEQTQAAERIFDLRYSSKYNAVFTVRKNRIGRIILSGDVNLAKQNR